MLDDSQEFGKSLSLFRKFCSCFNAVEGILVRDFYAIVESLNYSNKKKIFHLLTGLTSSNHPDVLTITDFSTFLKLYYCKYGCYAIFSKYCANPPRFDPSFPTLDLLTPRMTVSEFKAFLLTEQQESEQECVRVMSLIPFKGGSMSYYQFCRYIYSRDNHPVKHRCHSSESTYPLNFYYCLSSHNTYLSGNQLTSRSKVKRYIEDLENGYRCIELDVHDSPLGPIINHQYTLTSSILFEDVIRAIAKYSNSVVHTPIIFSLEIHCSPLGRFATATILMNHFGDKLLVIDRSWKRYPPLSSLFNRIIIKSETSADDLLLYSENEPNLDLLHSITGICKISRKEKLAECLTYTSMASNTLETRFLLEKEAIVLTTSKSWMRVYPKGTSFFS